MKLRAWRVGWVLIGRVSKGDIDWPQCRADPRARALSFCDAFVTISRRHYVVHIGPRGGGACLCRTVEKNQWPRPSRQ